MQGTMWVGQDTEGMCSGTGTDLDKGKDKGSKYTGMCTSRDR